MTRISREPGRPRGPVFHLDRDPGPDRGWNGVRHLLTDVAGSLGRDRVERVLREHRAAASLVVEDLAPAMTPGERRAADGLAARLTSHLSHNWAVQRPLFDAWAGILHDLLHGLDAVLLVSDLACLDWETLAACKALYRRFPDSAPGFRFHHDPHRPPPEPDPDGLLWQTRPGYVAEAALGFQILPGAVTVADAAPEPVAPEGPPSDRKGAVEPADPDLDAVVRRFRSCAFTAALRRGLELLEHRPDLEPRQAATAHALVALCAHNRQFRTAGNQALADFLERHLVAALETEDRPELRCALLYRLGVTVGRRRGDLEAARIWCDRGADEARELRRACERGEIGLSPLRVAYQEGWLRNIRAYVRMRLGDLDGGARDLRTAFERLAAARREAPPASGPEARSWSRDVELSHSLLAGNLAALSHLSGDRDGTHRWRAVGHELSRDAPGIERYEASQWIVLCRDFHLPRMALPQALEGLRGARRENDALWLHRLLTVTADLSDRLGRAHTTARLYRHAHRLRRELDDSPLLDRVELRAAAACARTGRFAEARSLLVEAATGRHGARTRSRLQVEIHTGMALLAARADNEATAEVSMEKALEHARTVGDIPLRLRALTAAGLARQLLGHVDAAADLYREALAVLGSDPGSAALAAEELRALVGLEEIAGPDRERMLRALERLPEALKDAEAWWDLPRLLTALARALATHELPAPEPAGRISDVLDQPLDLLAQTGSQRRDCVRPLAAVEGVLPGFAERIVQSRSRLGRSILESRPVGT